MNKRYFYSGPFSGCTLKTATGDREVLLHPNSHVDLPRDHDYVKTLIALGHLTEAPLPQAPASDDKTITKLKAGEK